MPMDKEMLIQELNQRLGYEGFEELLTEIDALINNALKFWSRYYPSSGKTDSVSISVTSGAYIFDAPFPDRIEFVFDSDAHNYYTGWCYTAPILSDMYPGNFIVGTVQVALKLSDFEPGEMPDLLHDILYGDYCTAINNVAALGELNIPVGINTQHLLQEGQLRGERAREEVKMYKDLP